MTTRSTLEKVQRIQWIMGTGYCGMGAWCLLHPSSVIALSLTPHYAVVNRINCLLMRCFGAQAMTAGLLLSTATMTERSFTAFGVAMIPYLGFNAWFGVGPGRGVFTKWLWMDFVGNVIFCTGSLYAAKLLRDCGKVEKKID